MGDYKYSIEATPFMNFQGNGTVIHFSFIKSKSNYLTISVVSKYLFVSKSYEEYLT